MSSKITSEKVLAALGKVQEPELHKDLVTLNMVKDLEINSEAVNFTILLTTPACPPTRETALDNPNGGFRPWAAFT